MRTVLDTNVVGVFNMTRAVVPHMISQRAGKIINISSVVGREGRARPDQLRRQQGRDQRLHARAGGRAGAAQDHGERVAPGVIETEMSQAVRELAGDEVKSRILLRAVRHGREEVAHAVWFLASRIADYITGQVLHVDGGFKME